ncbi:ABC transporter permease [Stieleria sp. JC731]|uniref:ABC transporter permease n=1 Tax=Pirellulaceae TaxID=2691357 RepID=UPI001E3DB5AC|nr:FtsX-like permease family protein [Stieleria sp. JC731]MCC9600056.1 ABC transporter permease [Stieleria sp. JC731]
MSSWQLITKLVISQLRLHPTRAVITTLGVIASTCAVVWVVSGYDALVSKFDENAGKYLGRYDVLVVPNGPPGTVATVDQDTIVAFRNDAGVLELNPISQTRASVARIAKPDDGPTEESSLGLVVGNRPPVFGAPPIDPTLVSTPAIEEPYELTAGQWLPEDENANVAVLSSKAAERLNIGIGDDVLVTTLANQVALRIVGIVEQVADTPSIGGRGGRRGTGGPPGNRSPHTKATEQNRTGLRKKVTGSDSRKANEQTQSDKFTLPTAFAQGVATNAIYVRPQLADLINGFASQPNVLQIALRDTVTVDQFRHAWETRFGGDRPSLSLVDFSAVREGLKSTRSVSSQRSQAWAATGMASMAAIFIIFSTLSMGVSERVREFAMLRAIALERSHIAAIIAMESVVLALIGWVGGLVAGGLLVMIGSQILPGLFNSGSVLGWTSVGLSGLTVLVGALGAAIFPAWRATHIAPLEAMSQRNNLPTVRTWFLIGIIGLALSAITPTVVFFLPMANRTRVLGYSLFAYPALFVGMLLLTPLIVVISERLFGPIVTWILRLNSRMVKTQLTGNMWRTVGATLALSIGLGLYTSTQTWGYSMLQPFLPGDWLPDMLVAFHPIGVDEEDIPRIGEVDGVDPDQVLPLSIEQSRFDWQGDQAPEGLKHDNAVIVGLDPSGAFGCSDPFLKLDFVDGDQETALKELSKGDACVIAQDFQMLTGMQVGQVLRFTPPNAPNETVQYKIVGVVALPGWQWVTKFSGVRRHFVRTSSIVFASFADVRNDFHLTKPEFFWLNLEPDASLTLVEEQLQKIAERKSGTSFRSDNFGEVVAYRPFARATATSNVMKAIRIRANDMIWGMSYLPLVTLMIMSLAVVNTVVASVRSRTWEFGVMRAVGLTSGQLVRLIMAESLLIGFAACTLSLTFGLIAGWCGVGMAQFGGHFFGGAAQFVIPWKNLAIGFGITFALCILAAVWPSIRIGKAETLALLQAGRGST